MGIIQCADLCAFQIDGYCALEKCSTPKLFESDCPYYVPKSLYNFDSLSQTANSNKLY